MEKIYMVAQEIKELASEHWVFKNEEDAKKKVGELVGTYILDLLNEGNKDGALEFVGKLAIMGNPYGYYTDDEETYVEELELK